MGFDRDGHIVAMQIDTLAALGGYLSNLRPASLATPIPKRLPGSIVRRTCICACAGSIPTRCLLTRIAARAGRRPPGTTSVLSSSARMSSASISSRYGDEISSRGRTFPTLHRAAAQYHSGDPPALLDKLLAIADYPALRREQKQLRRKGVLMGLGMACFIDKAGTGPSGNLAKRGGLHGGWNAPSYARTQTARLHCSRAAIRMDRATTSPSARSPPTVSASISTTPAGRRRYRPNSFWQRHLGCAFDLRCRNGDLLRLRQGTRQGPTLCGPHARMP